MNKTLKDCNGFKLPVLIYATLAEAISVGGTAPDGSISPEKGEALVLTQVNNNLYYRGTAPEARQVLADAFEDLGNKLADQVPEAKRQYVPVFKEVTKKDESGKETKVKESVMKDGAQVTEPVLNDTKYVDVLEGLLVGRKVLWQGADGELSEVSITHEWLQAQVDAYLAGLKNDDGTPFVLSVDITETPRKTPQPKKLADKYKEMAKRAITEGKVPRVLAATEKLTGAPYTRDGKALDEAALADVEAVGWLIKAWSEAREKDALANV